VPLGAVLGGEASNALTTRLAVPSKVHASPIAQVASRHIREVTPLHLFSAVAYGAIAALGAEFGAGGVFGSLLAVMLLAVLIAVLKNVLWVIAAAIVGSIPILGWLVVLYFLVVRWEFICKHRGVLASSFALYSAPYLIAAMFRGVPLVAFLAGVVLWQLVSTAFYRRGYSPGHFLKVTALGPSVVLLLLLPFLDLDLGLDLDLDTDLDPAGGDLGEPGIAATAPAGGQTNPEVEWVEGHDRTLPDGNSYNNLSHPGGPTEPVGELTSVEGYYRTVADGDPTSNFSSTPTVPPPGAVDQGLVTGAPAPDPGQAGSLHPALDPSVATAAMAGGVAAVGRETVRKPVPDMQPPPSPPSTSPPPTSPPPPAVGRKA
jgi:hypothetical protein